VLNKVWVHNCGEEGRVLLRKAAVASGAASTGANWATPQKTAETAMLAVQEQEEGATPLPQRPEPLSGIREISPVPDEVWRRAKARRDNML